MASEQEQRNVDEPLRTASQRRRRRTLLSGAAGTVAVAVLGTAAALTLRADRTQPVRPDPGRPAVGTPSASAAPGVSPSPPAPRTPAPSPPTPRSEPPAGTRRVAVHFFTGQGRCDQVRAYARDVPRAAPLRPALEELFAGPRAEERAPGGPPPPKVGLRSVRVVQERVYVDLDADRFPGVYTTSCGGSLFNAQLRATVDGIVPGAKIIVALDGDPERFVQAQQGFCPEPAALGDRCDRSGF